MNHDPLRQADGDDGEATTFEEGTQAQWRYDPERRHHRQDVGYGESHDSAERHANSANSRENLMSLEQDEAIRLLQRQVKALQDHIDNGLPSVVVAKVGVNWPK